MNENDINKTQKIKSGNKNKFAEKPGEPWADPIALRINAATSETKNNCDLLLRYLVQRSEQNQGNAG